MKRKHFILALVAMLWSFSFSTFAQGTVVVNSFEELKAEVEKRKVARTNAMRTARATTSSEIGFGTVALGNDIVLSETYTMDATELTLDLNGYKISSAQGASYKFINEGSTTIHDESAAKTGTINCAIQNGTEEIDYAYLEIQGGTVKSLDATGAAITNYGECKILGGKFFSEYVGLTNYNEMTVDGGTNSNVYIEGKNYSIKNSSNLAVENAVIAGTEESYLDEGGTETFNNVTYYQVALNGQGYAKLQDAVDAAADGDLIRLFGNIEEDVVSINKAITLDGNEKSLAGAIKVSETTGAVNITDLTVTAESDYALQLASAATVNVTSSSLSGTGAVMASTGTVVLDDTDLSGSNEDVISVASNVIVNMEGGSITSTANSDAKAFIIGGAEDCTGAQLSIMAQTINLGSAVNFISLDTDKNTVKLHRNFKQDLYDNGYAIEEKGLALTVRNAVANVGDKNYTTLAEALTAATDGSTVTLLWADYKAPIAMAGTVCGNKTVTITGTADVDWDKGWLYVGRNGEGNGKLIFREANLTSKSVGISNNGIGLNVSCKEEGSATTNDGEVEIIDSRIQLDYLIGKGNIKLDNSTLNVYEGFAVGARPASETGGQQRTVTMDITNGSNVIVTNHNSQGLGYEALGVMNIDATSTFETTQSFLVTAKGTMNVNGGTVKIVGTLTNNGTVYATGAANLDAKVAGAGWFYMNGVNLDADTKLDGAKVAFINGTNTVVGSTIKNGYFSVGVGQNDAATAAATFASANGITLGDVTVNVSENATVYTSTDAAYSGWVGSAYSADKTQNTYTLNITNSLARFGYMHVSKDGVLKATGHSENKYEYAGNTVDFYVGDFINNGVVTLDGVDAWAQRTKISVDHADAVLNITNGTQYMSNCTTGNVDDKTFLYHKAGTVNVDATSSVNIQKATTFVDGAVLNIAGNVTAKGAVTGAGTITLTDEAAVYTAPADLTVGTTVDNKIVVYENGAYLLKDAVAKIGDVCYLTFADAMDAANAMTGEVTVEVLAAVEFVNGMELNGSYTTINFVGKNAEAKMTINQTAGGDYLEAHGKNVNFTDLTLAKANPAWSGNSGHMGNYFTVQGGTATYTNCTFLNGACTSGGTATYNDCTFQNAKEYGLWAYDDALVTVNGGTFDSKKGIKVYSEDETSVTTTLTVQNATFTENVTEKPAVAVGYAASVTLIGNTYNNPTAHIELDSGSDADCEGVTFVAQDASGNDISATLDMTDRSNSDAACGVLVDGKVYTTVTTAVQDAVDGSNVTILYSTEEAAEFVPGVNINLADGVTADNVVVADRLTDYVVLPEGVDESNFVFKFGANTVTDGTNYYPTLQKAVEAVAGQANAVLYCKPGADVGSLQHAPVTSTLTIYGNNANVTGGDERDFDLGNTDPSLGKDITADMTLTVKHLNGCGAWGAKATEHTVNLVFENCANMGKVFITGATGVLNITMTDCAFEGVIKEAVYSNADGAITLTNVAFSNLNKAVNLNHKAAGTQTVTIDGCSFTDCGADVAADQIPVRVLSSVAGGKSVLNVNNSTFTGTPDGGADILLDYNGLGLTYATITNTTANVMPENEAGNAEMVAVTEADVYEYCNADVQVGDTKYRTFGEAVAAVKNGGTITLLNDITATNDYTFVQAPNVQVTIEGNNKTFAGTITVDGKSAAYPTAGLTIKNVKFDATNIAKDASINLGGNNSIRYTNGVTVDNCTFTGEGKAKVGVKNYTGGCKNITITNCTATGMHSLAQLYQTTGVTLTNNTVTDSKNGVSLRNSTNVTVTNCTMDVEGYGVRADGGAAVVVTDSKIEAFIPVAVRKATAETFLTFNGNNTMTASNTEGLWCAIGMNEYGDVVDGTEITKENLGAATGKVRVTLNDATLDKEGVYGNFVPVAVIGTEDYSSLQDAVNAVKNGETITLIEDIVEELVTIEKASGLAFTIDGQNHKFTGEFEVGIGEEITIKNVNFVATDKISPEYFIDSMDKNSNCILTITGCTFTDTDYSTAAIGTHQPTKVVIDGCTAQGVHSLLQNQGGYNITVKNTTVNGARGMSLGTVVGATVENVTINAADDKYGIRLNGEITDNTITIKDSKISAFIPVVVRKAQVDNYNVVFDGTNTMTAANTDGYWCVIGTSEYEKNGEMPTPATGKVKVTLNDAGLPLDGIYGNFGVASIGKATYLTFAEALEAVQDGEIITLTGGESNAELETEIEFTKGIKFTITGNAPKYALPVVTFQNATVTIKDAEILIPELDARENATIDVVNSIVHDAGGNSIAKSYFNGTINIDETSTVYMMQVTTMGYINVAGTLNATWQTNVYGNGMITLAEGATFNTAGLNLIGKDYDGRDNTDEERVGKPATIVVDGANLTIGKVLSDNGADYSYNAEKYGINVGTIDGKSAILDIKNGGIVNIFMADGHTVNFGAGATVNVNASTLTTACRAAEGTVTLANNGTVNVTGESNLNIKNVSGNAINVTDATLADVQFGGAVNAFGTNNISGTSAIGGVLSVGYNGNPAEQVVVNITGNFNGTNVLVGSSNESVLNVGKADGERTTAYFGQLGGFGDVTINNADITYGYAFIRNDFNVTNSTLAVTNANTYIAGNAKVVVDNSTWKLGAHANIGSYGGYMWGNADVTLINGSTMTATNLGIERSEDYVVKVAIDETSSLTATNLTNQGVMNVAGTVTASTKLANTGTINFTSLAAKLVTPTTGVTINHEFDENYKIVYKDGVYSFGDFVAEIDGVYYDDIKTALQALTEGATLKFLNDVTVTEAWDCRYTGGLIAVPNVTINGNGKTLKLTGEVSDPNTFAVFRVAANNVTFKNLTIDVSEAEKVQRCIAASLSITVENCKFIGNGTTSRYGVIYGEGAGDAIGTVVATITGSEFVNNSYGVSDNRKDQDAKSVTVTGNTFTNSKVLLSAAETVTFDGNKVEGASVSITSYTNATNVAVNANDNTLDAAQVNQITTNPERQNVQGGFAIPVATSNNVYYLTLPGAIEAAAADAEVALINSVEGAGVVINKNITIDFRGNTYTFNKGVGSSANTESNGFQILQGNTVTLKNGTLNVAEEAKATFYTIIQNYADLTVEDMTLDGTNLDKWSATDGDSYVLSINSGNVVIKGNTNITANDEGDKAFAFDACKYQNYEAPVVTVETSGTIEGLIESTATIVIKRGTYTMDVTQWCAEGLTAQPDGNGLYTIVIGVTFIDGQFTEYTNTVDMDAEYISYTRNFSTVWTPFYVPFEVPVSQLAEQGFEVAYINGVRRTDDDNDGELDKFVMEVIYIHGGNADGSAKTLKANYPYFIRSKSGVTTMNITLEDVILYAAKDVSYDCTTMTEKFEITGNNQKMTSDKFASNQFIVSSDGWRNIQEGSYLNPFRFYMTETSRYGSETFVPMTTMSIAVRGEEREDGTTLIYDVEMDGEPTTDYIYDLQGRRVLEPQKGGLYIVNGKKVIF